MKPDRPDVSLMKLQNGRAPVTAPTILSDAAADRGADVLPFLNGGESHDERSSDDR